MDLYQDDELRIEKRIHTESKQTKLYRQLEEPDDLLVGDVVQTTTRETIMIHLKFKNCEIHQHKEILAKTTLNMKLGLRNLAIFCVVAFFLKLAAIITPIHDIECTFVSNAVFLFFGISFIVIFIYLNLASLSVIKHIMSRSKYCTTLYNVLFNWPEYRKIQKDIWEPEYRTTPKKFICEPDSQKEDEQFVWEIDPEELLFPSKEQTKNIETKTETLKVRDSEETGNPEAWAKTKDLCLKVRYNLEEEDCLLDPRLMGLCKEALQLANSQLDGT